MARNFVSYRLETEVNRAAHVSIHKISWGEWIIYAIKLICYGPQLRHICCYHAMTDNNTIYNWWWQRGNACYSHALQDNMVFSQLIRRVWLTVPCQFLRTLILTAREERETDIPHTVIYVCTDHRQQATRSYARKVHGKPTEDHYPDSRCREETTW